MRFRLPLSIVATVLIGIGGIFVCAAQTDAMAQKPSEDNQLNYVAGVLINDAGLARQNWILNCQGCHRANAVGLGEDMPNMNGQVSKFLRLEDGRAYIGQVNGIVNSPLNDEDLADLINWMFATYDPTNIPKDFRPFTAEEVHEFRKSPMSHDGKVHRTRIVAEIEKNDQRVEP